METSITRLSTQNLTIGYTFGKTDLVIARDIQIDLAHSQLIGLIGINGSGKSTLLRTLAGLQPPLGGSVSINGRPMASTPAHLLAKELSVVLTNQPISKNLSVGQLVALGRQPYTNWLGSLTQKDTTAIQQALTDTETLDLIYKKCYELSDGQLQRVLIARAIAQETDMILLDEPMAHLDLHHKASILKLLYTLAHSHKKTILFSTHDIDHTLQHCDTVMVLQEDRITHKKAKNLIEDGIFDTLFPSKNIAFDRNSRTFFIK